MFRRWRGYLARRGQFLQVPPTAPVAAPAAVPAFIQPDSVRWRTLRTRRGVLLPVPPTVVAAATPAVPVPVRSRRPSLPTARRGRFLPVPQPLVVLLAETVGQAVAGNNAVATVTSRGGTLLVALVTRSGGLATGALTGVTDSAGNTWQLATRGSVSGGTNTRIECWYAVNAAPVTSVTFASAISQTWAWDVLEFSGTVVPTPLDGASTDNSGVSVASASIATPAVTDSYAPDLVIAAAHFGQTTATLATAGFTATADFDDSTVGSGRGAWQVTGNAPGTVGPVTWTLGAARVAGTLTVGFRVLGSVSSTAPAQAPAVQRAQPRRALQLRRGRLFATIPAPAVTVAPPWVPAVLRPSTRRALLARRGDFQPTPPSVPGVPPPARRAPVRGVLIRRGQFLVVPPAPVATVSVPPPPTILRPTTRRGLVARRGVLFPPPTLPGALPGTAPTPPRAIRQAGPLRVGWRPRRHLFEPPWPAITSAVQPRVPGLLSPRRPSSLRVIRRARIEPPASGATRVPGLLSPRRPQAYGIRRGRFFARPTGGLAVGPGPVAPQLRSTRRRYGFRPPRGRFIEPVWPYVPPPLVTIGVMSAGVVPTSGMAVSSAGTAAMNPATNPVPTTTQGAPQ